ncbi:BatD family protein [Alteromonas facilis]|uniref:BatD family protein n=1 Tax=Alteromonas facilis TaxID=2048004 RepID=UPI000C28D560|nr:BatD family protein [Alteromonas facilis]
MMPMKLCCFKSYRIGQLMLAIVFMMFSAFAHAEVTSVITQVDKNPVMLDESFTLSVTADGDVDRNAFDSSFLLKDFVVGQTSVSSQTRMVNFKTSRSTTWSVILFPRAVGEYTIPPVTIEGHSSAPIKLSVVPVSNVNGQETRDIFVTTEMDSNEVYIHQQVRYTVKLYLAKDIERGSLQAPELEDAEIRQIGKDAEYSEIVNGKRYRIIERTFAVLPQKSGDFTINGPVFQGEVIANTNQSFGFFNRTQTVNRVGPPQTLTVLPAPASIAGTFLPSEFVDISEEWSGDIENWTVGEPITRTLTLTAVGLTDTALPEIDDRYPPSIKTYPDQANTTSAENAQSIVAQRTESIALIPSQAGKFVLLPVEIEWFNVVTKQTEKVVIPARTIEIKAASNSNSTANAITSGAGQDDGTTSAIEDNKATTPSLNQAQQDSALVGPSPIFEWRWSNGWMWTTGLFAALSLILIYRRPTIVQTPQIREQQVDKMSEKLAWQSLCGALKSKHKEQIAKSLLAWINSLSDKTFIALPHALDWINDDGLAQLVQQMMESQYSNVQQNWRADQLQKHLTALRKQRTNKSTSGDLPELYPS